MSPDTFVTYLPGRSDNPVIFGMRPDPEPHDTIVHVRSEGSVTIADAHRPEGTNAFEMK